MNKHQVWKLVTAVALAVMLVAPGVQATSTVFQSPPPGPPSNDNFVNATVITSLPFSDSIDNTLATAEPGEPQYCSYSPQTVWYAFTPTANALVRADMAGSNISDTVLTVYQAAGPGFGGLNFISCTSSYGGVVTFQVQAGTTYYLQAGSIYSGGGNLHVNLQEVLPPPNDNFANAKVIPSLPFDDTEDTAGASVQADEPTPPCAYNGLMKTVWYAFTPQTSGSISANILNYYFTPMLAAYTGTSLTALTLVGCQNYGELLTFHADAGTTYYFQVGVLYPWDQGGSMQFHLDVAPLPVASFYFSPYDPTVFDNVQFYGYYSYDPTNIGIQYYGWNFGDGTSMTSTDCCPIHRYTKDGTYTVKLTVTTFDGRAASTSQVVAVKTHDVAITKFSVPQSASSGQTRQIVVGVNSRRYPETVQVDLYKSSLNGYQFVGTTIQSVPVRSANRTTDFNFSYTFTKDDAILGKVTFRAVAIISGVRDALPADNEAISLPTKVTR